MFGYATNETKELMPLPILLAHKLTKKLTDVRKNGELSWVRPDGKSQVSVRYEDNKPTKIETVVISTQHAPEISQEEISREIIDKVIKPVLGNLWNDQIKTHSNPTGKCVIGGPHGDAGLTGRKSIVDTYGGFGRHGGGAFSGKDPSKVDRSACYMCRYIAKNLVAAELADRCEVQLAYAIGVAEPVGLYVNTYGTSKLSLSDGEIASKLSSIFDMRPYAIETRFNLRSPIYSETAAYGHMGRKCEIVEKEFTNGSGETKQVKVKLFPWEELNYVEKVKELSGKASEKIRAFDSDAIIADTVLKAVEKQEKVNSILKEKGSNYRVDGIELSMGIPPTVTFTVRREGDATDVALGLDKK